MKLSLKLLIGLTLNSLTAFPSPAQTPPSISVSMAPSSADEGARFLVTFKRAGDLSKSASAAWAVAGAVDGTDFGRSAPPSGAVNFKIGQAQKGFWLYTTNDTTAEPDETFSVVLSAPKYATIGVGQASATILNNDAPGRSPLTLVNPSHPAHWAREDAFLNHMLVTSATHDQWVKSGFFDAVSAKFVRMPSSGNIRLGPVRGGGVPASLDHYKGKWILDWQGDGDLSITGGAGAQTRVSTNRIEEDYDPALHGYAAPIIRINRIGPAGVWNIRFYRAEHEALLDAGEVFNPRWLADMGRFDVIRPMDWSGVNGDYELAAADRPRANRPFYVGGRVPDWVIIRAAVDSGAQLWLHAPGLLGCPQSVADTLRDPAVPQASRIAAARGAFDQVMASNEPLLWARAIVAELNAQGYPASRPLFIELDNEVWNTKFVASTEFYWGLGEEVAARHPGLAGDMRTGYGYRSAQVAELFARALAEGGRANQAWTMVIGAHTVNVTRTVDALAAVKAYGGPQPMGRYGVATTNYFSGGFRWHAENMLFGAPLDQATWRQRWLSELKADPAALRQRITNYLLSPTPMRMNVAYFGANIRAHKKEAEAAGARWIGNFEGDSTETLDFALGLNAAAVSLFYQWHESDDHGRVITALADEIRAVDPSALMATYVFCAARRTTKTPWVECTPWSAQTGGDNAAWNLLLKP